MFVPLVFNFRHLVAIGNCNVEIRAREDLQLIFNMQNNIDMIHGVYSPE